MIPQELLHYGTKRHSGRYPWGSGDNPYQHSSSFLERVDELKKQGFTEKEIADAMGMSIHNLRSKKSSEKRSEREAITDFVLKKKEAGWSNTAIAEALGRNESYVRTILKPSVTQTKNDVAEAKKTLLDQLETTGYLDVGKGTELYLNGGISSEKLRTALRELAEEGYVVENINVPQVFGDGVYTTTTVLAHPGNTKRDIWEHRDDITSVATVQSEKGGKDYMSIRPPVSVDSKRISVRYAEDGGEDLDGLVEIRPGSKDLDMGGSRYAQVRIAVDDTHYIKGMAVYSNDLPTGVDIRVNTNKKRGTPLKSDDGSEVLKRLDKNNPDNPFGTSITRQLEYTDSKGKAQLSALNIVNSEGDWTKWSNTLSSQFVSKQGPDLAKKQLGLSLNLAKDQFDEIMQVSNPVVKKSLLKTFSDQCDTDAVHLRAAAMPRQSWKVILPSTHLKDNEIYAPDYRHGEKVVLVRYPHAGTFEIPELVVNNKIPAAKKLFPGGDPLDAVVISSKAAAKLSGADFDGDTVLVLPNNKRQIKSHDALPGLKGFDPKKTYPQREGTKLMAKGSVGRQMGDITNLITDMQVKGPGLDDPKFVSELTRAVKHSMVVIDAYKHKLDYQKSYDDNGIAALKEKYQGGKNKGASTLISLASSQKRVDARTPRSYSKGGPIDKKTGELVFDPVSKKTKQTISTKMYETKDARTLSSGTVVENIYASYANSMKGLANAARKEYISAGKQVYSPTAAKAYKKEVDSLNAKLNVALMNAPLERKAVRLANERIFVYQQDNPQLDKDSLKKLKARELVRARATVGAGKKMIDITQSEWNAIQAGAISQTKLEAILANSNMSLVKKLALPKTQTGLTPAKLARAKALVKSGYTRSQVADALGVSVSTITKAVGVGG